MKHHHHHQKDLLIRDVTLRDGLQNLPEVLSTDDKLAILDALIAAGVKDFQLTSFVNPARVPQMHDAETIYAEGVARGLTPNVLVANLKGFERAVAAGVKSVDAVISASNVYQQKNSGRTILESANEITIMLSRAAHAGCKVDIGLANCFHCFSEGHIDSEIVMALTRSFHDAGARTIWLSDTTGYATPDQITTLVKQCQPIGVELGLHLHDTQGRAGDNALAGYRAGVRRFDAVLSGLGGSPFTPGVGGNLSMETAQAVFTGAGIATGIDTGKMDVAREKLSRGIARAGAA
ncbi:MAG: hydroxymethylglutaryl-CoA lyase [Rhodospirillaceae bacterium]|nr:hydroxymethylglutaryl-CoA lyase [Rhodospirillaceae bacterium]